jgi:predicted nucleic acid-binding protein
VKISAALLGVSRLCIETAPLIYFVEQNPLYIDRVRAIIQEIHRGNIEGFSSVITLTEVLTLPKRLQRTDLEQAYQKILLNSRNFSLIPINKVIAQRAAELRAQYSLKTPDALQVAVGLENHCDAFLTNDLGLKRVREIKILVVDELQLDAAPPTN